MSDLDATDAPLSTSEELAYIREAILVGHDMRTPLFQLAHKLLAEVDRLRKQLAEYESAINWSTSCLACSRMLDSSIAEHERAEDAEAEVERLRANQLPDGGEWSEEFMHHDRAETLAGWSVRSHSCNDGCGMRRVWRSPVQRPESDSAASDTPAESTSDQTAPKTA